MNTDLNCAHSFGRYIWDIYIYIYLVLLHLNKQTKNMSQIAPDKRRMGDCWGRSEFNFQIADKSTLSHSKLDYPIS